MLAVRYSEDAAADLLRVAESELEISVSRATRVLDAIERVIGLLRVFPGLAHEAERAGVPPPLMVWHAEAGP